MDGVEKPMKSKEKVREEIKTIEALLSADLSETTVTITPTIREKLESARNALHWVLDE